MFYVTTLKASIQLKKKIYECQTDDSFSFSAYTLHLITKSQNEY